MLDISIVSKNSYLSKNEIVELKKYSKKIIENAFIYISNKENTIFSNISKQLCYIDLLITNNVLISKFNFEYRGIKEPTNVLSLQMFHVSEINNINHEHIHLGSIAVSIEYTKAEAEGEHIDWHTHYARLLIHGFLHCLGYDHNDDTEAHIMYNLENEILKYCEINEDSLVSKYWL